MKLLSFQPFSLSTNSGGGRILRRLYQGHEADIISIGLSLHMNRRRRNNHKATSQSKGTPEIMVPAYPLAKTWQRWYARDFTNWLREKALRPLTTKSIQNTAETVSCDIIHIVDHYSFSAALCEERFIKNKPLWVSFHDHFATTKSSFNSTKVLWQSAERRLCISPEIGKEYQRLFGSKDFELITDGVRLDEISEPRAGISEPVVIYFAGMLHIDYFPLFKVLADALDVLTKQGLPVKLILRGAYKMDFLDNRQFEVEYRPITIDDKELKAELDAASILYLPMYFTVPEFYLYSLSTKMVGYLAAPGSILYHGPANSAASVLLEKNQSAFCCNTLETNDMVVSIKNMVSSKLNVSANAKTLVRAQFNLDAIRDRFWKNTSNVYE